MLIRLILGLSLTTFLACGDDDGADAGIMDATSGQDSGTDAASDAGGDDASGDDAGADDAGSEDLATAFCEGSIARDERCGETPPDLGECVAEQQCTLNVIFRADAAPEVVSCIADLECESSDDPCFTATGLGLEPSEGADDYSTACLVRREECGGGFSDDFCFADLVAAGVYDSLTTCFAEDCDAIGDCLLGVLVCAE